MAHVDLLPAAAERTSQAGVEWEVELISGSRNADLAARISGMAAGLKAGLIVTGSRGREAFTGSLLGSVTHNPIKFATVRVLVVNASKEE